MKITEEEYSAYLINQESFEKRLWKIFVEFAKIQKLDLASCYRPVKITEGGVLYEGWSYGDIYDLLPAKFIYDRDGWEGIRLNQQKELAEYEKQKRAEAIDKIRELFQEFPDIKENIKDIV